jgi:hypothetical protein
MKFRYLWAGEQAIEVPLMSASWARAYPGLGNVRSF